MVTLDRMLQNCYNSVGKINGEKRKIQSKETGNDRIRECEYDISWGQ